MLLYDTIVAKEVKRRKNEYTHSAGNRDGQDCLNFFFDLINDCAGYTDKYYKETHDRITTEQLIQKYRREKEKHIDTQFKDSPLLGDHYPHCLLVFEGVEKLYRMGARYKH